VSGWLGDAAPAWVIALRRPQLGRSRSLIAETRTHSCFTSQHFPQTDSTKIRAVSAAFNSSGPVVTTEVHRPLPVGPLSVTWGDDPDAGALATLAQGLRQGLAKLRNAPPVDLRHTPRQLGSKITTREVDILECCRQAFISRRPSSIR
jgi:hypothetical protein